MRPPGEDPDGWPRRQSQRGGCSGGDGFRDQGELAELTDPGDGWFEMERMVLAALLPVSACASYPATPEAAYRATGTEPFWSLTIDDRNIAFSRPEEQPIVQPRPKVIIGFAGEIYQTPRINVNIVHVQCSDGMSDRNYPDRVQVTVDGQRFNGCGGLQG
jgi:uncharacterized membrane protein